MSKLGLNRLEVGRKAMQAEAAAIQRAAERLDEAFERAVESESPDGLAISWQLPGPVVGFHRFFCMLQRQFMVTLECISLGIQRLCSRKVVVPQKYCV